MERAGRRQCRRHIRRKPACRPHSQGVPYESWHTSLHGYCCEGPTTGTHQSGRSRQRYPIEHFANSVDGAVAAVVVNKVLTCPQSHLPHLIRMRGRPAQHLDELRWLVCGYCETELSRVNQASKLAG